MDVINQGNIHNYLYRRLRVRQNNVLYVGKLWYCDHNKFKLKSCRMWLIHGRRHLSAGFYKLVIFSDYQDVTIILESQALLNFFTVHEDAPCRNSGQTESRTDSTPEAVLPTNLDA